ncbi:MAG: TlyA family RNA methyltransferase [Mogibacterium sp.]|nr:TlyA family RNA methyltransferase [Mogibacterium sp.]
MKERLDVLLVQSGLVSSRDRAKRLIMAGLVTVDGRVEDKAGQKFDVDADIALKEDPCRYVSRGGLKLEKAIGAFGLDFTGCICMDMGASTGGFTDCMLQNGAARVYAVDVGYGQLDYRLRVDERVVNIEKTNIRYLDTSLIRDPIDFVTIDVSFISVRHMFPVACKVLKPDGEIISLIKPQFEAGREEVGKKGIVRDPAVHVDVINKVIGYADECGLYPVGLTWSPITGTKGNIEYLIHLKRKDAGCSDAREAAEIAAVAEISPSAVVSLAHEELE